MADVDFFFDFISPYTYLARTQLDGIAARTGARFRMWPMHLLNLMKIVGNTPTSVVCRNKRKYAVQDIGRWCARYQVPVELNPHLMKGDHSLTLKGALVAQETRNPNTQNAWKPTLSSLPSAALLVHRPLSSAMTSSLGTIGSTSSKKDSSRARPRSVFEGN